jgi:hypothetical protein
MALKYGVFIMVRVRRVFLAIATIMPLYKRPRWRAVGGGGGKGGWRGVICVQVRYFFEFSGAPTPVFGHRSLA